MTINLKILSLGAGVQSTVLALMACDGSLPGLDGAIFADTGWEPPSVYEQVDRLEAEFKRAGIPLYRVEFDRQIRKGGARASAGQLNGEAFLHRSRVPLELAPIDRVTAKEWHDRQTDIFDALAETGDLDGCSPYGCRSGDPVEMDA